MKTTSEDIARLVAEYNEVERFQDARLIELYRAMRDRQGARFVEFSNGEKWGVNQFQPGPENIVFPRVIGTMSRFIDGFEPGEDGTGEPKDDSDVHRFVRSAEEAALERAQQKRKQRR